MRRRRRNRKRRSQSIWVRSPIRKIIIFFECKYHLNLLILFFLLLLFLINLFLLFSSILSQSIDEKFVRKQNQASFLMDLSRNPIGRTLVFDFIVENWNYCWNEFGRSLFTLNNLIETVTNKFSTRSELLKVSSFVESEQRTLGTTRDTFETVLEKIRTNMEWSNKNFRQISNWLQIKSNQWISSSSNYER